jgi:hypothetical protein
LFRLGSVADGNIYDSGRGTVGTGMSCGSIGDTCDAGFVNS